MKQTEQQLLNRNKIAATLGQDIVLEILKQYREQFISTLKTTLPSTSDPYALNTQRALGRVEAVDYLINLGEQSIKNNDK